MSTTSAFDHASALLEQNQVEQAMDALTKAAYAQDPEAQYLLGSMLLEEAQEEDDEHEDLIMDAEAKRQQINRDEDPKDIRTIRKKARKVYMAYVRAQRAANTQPTPSSTSDPLIQRANVEELDRVFGKTMRRFLDPSFPLAPLSTATTKDAKDATKAVEWIRRAAENGHVDAHVQLGNLCLSEDPPLAPAAITWYSRVGSLSSENPHPDALYNLGLLYYNGVDEFVDTDPKASLPYFFKAAEVGDASAQYFVGHLLHHGDPELGIASNMQSALLLLESAASQGHSGAMFYLAQLYRSGDEEHGIEANRSQFLEFLNQAIACHDADALYCMADIYFHGSDGFETDSAQAKTLYEQAAAAGSPEAYCCLGAMYYNGLGVAQDDRKAFTYYQAAADRHSMQAWKNLAEMYLLGRGVPKNAATADSILNMLQKQSIH